MNQGCAAPPPPPIHHPMPNHQQGGSFHNPSAQTFAGTQPQTRAPNDNALGLPTDRFNTMNLNNMTLNNGTQRNKMPTTNQNGIIPVEHEGWRFRRYPGQKKWADIVKTPMSLDRTELLNIVKKMRNKSTVDKQYSSLRSSNQRLQIDKLLEEKRFHEHDPGAEWVLACVKDVHSKINNGWGPDETTELQVILKRHSRQKRTVIEKGLKNVTSVVNPPGQRVSLAEKSTGGKSGTGMKPTVKPGQMNVQQQHDVNGQTRGLNNNGPVGMQNGFQGSQAGPSNFPPPHGPMPPQPTQNIQRGPQDFQPKVVPNEGRPMNPTQGPPVDSFDPRMPIIEVGSSQPSRPPPPLPQIRQQRHEGLHDNPVVTNPLPFQGYDDRNQQGRPRTKQPSKPRYDRRRDSGIVFDESDESYLSDGSRYSFDDAGRYSPASLPTTISLGSPRRKGALLANGDFHGSTRRHQSRVGHHSGNGRRASRDSMDYLDNVIDMIPNRRNDRREDSRYPRQLPARPRYKDHRSSSFELEGRLDRLEDIRRDEQDRYDRVRREEEAYERKRNAREFEDYERDMFRDDGRRAGGVYRR